ncbi:MAG: efflux RND transporter periplasmic adaptor subunit [Patescibacteria group bacterium]
MTKKKKIWLIIIAVIVIFIIVSIVLVASNGKKAEYVTATVERTTLKQSVDATGKIESAEKIDLNFRTTGRISQILVKVGDEVKTGRVLARLEGMALQSQIDDAIARVNQAQASYDQLIAGSSPEDIRVAENTAAQRQQDLIAAGNNLENLMDKRDIELLNLRDTVVTYLNNEIVTAKNAMGEIDNTLNDKDAEDTLSVQNSFALVLAERSESDANQAIIDTKNDIVLINSLSDDEEVLNVVSSLQNTLNLVNTALSNTADVLSYTIVSSNLSEAELDALKNNIATDQAGIKTAKTNIQTAKTNWTNKIVYYQDQVTIYEDAITNAQKALAIANSQLELKKSPPRSFEVDSAKAVVDQAKASLKLALANSAETIITAPIDGVVVKKNYNPGEQTSLASAVLEMIGESNLQIEVDIPESDISKIETGQDVEITLDAFGDEEIFPGKVTFVDPAETVIQDVVYYKVKVQLDNMKENASYDIKPGMTANVVIYTNKKENVLMVPARAVKSNNGDKYVEILVNGSPEEKIVTTGVKGDDGIEIMSGLEEGDEVITFVRE